MKKHQLVYTLKDKRHKLKRKKKSSLPFFHLSCFLSLCEIVKNINIVGQMEYIFSFTFFIVYGELYLPSYIVCIFLVI